MSVETKVRHAVVTDVLVSGGQGWVRLDLPELNAELSMSPSVAMELARKLIETGWNQR